MTAHGSLKQRLLRADWLRELHGLLVACLVLSALGLVAVVAMAIFAPLSVAVPADHVVTANALHGLTGGAELDLHGEVGLTVANPSPYQAILGALTVLPTGLVVLMMLAVLVRVVRDARRTDPFTEATVRRLRQLGAVVIIGGVLAWVVEFYAQFALAGTVTETGSGATLTLLKPAIWLLVGFGYLAIAEVVSRGRAMRAELDRVI